MSAETAAATTTVEEPAQAAPVLNEAADAVVSISTDAAVEAAAEVSAEVVQSVSQDLAQEESPAVEVTPVIDVIPVASAPVVDTKAKTNKTKR